MFAYVVRRVLYAVPILIGVNLITFALFFIVNTPDDMARMQLGARRVTTEAVEKWKAERGYDLPLVWNAAAQGTGKATRTIFFQKSVRLFVFDFGYSEDKRDIAAEIKARMWPSLALALPVFLVGLAVCISFALLMAFFRATYLDFWGVVLCVAMMSISTLFYIIGGQYLVSKLWSLVPISGFQPGPDAVKFLALPVAIALVGGFGEGVRLYRTFFLEEMNKDYVRTARAKGLAETAVLFGHVLKNGSIPILTGVVAAIPKLFLGSLLAESFFGIPGLGSYTIDAIQAQDFAVVRSMSVHIGSVLYIAGLILTDISYTLVDPRIRLNSAHGELDVRRPGHRCAGLAAGCGGSGLRHLLPAPTPSRAPERVFRSPAAMASLVVLGAYVALGLLDSLHFRPTLEQKADAPSAYASEVLSVLDLGLAHLRGRGEKTYSAPLATRSYAKELI
jgi:peptide/nickel transport system permease protein